MRVPVEDQGIPDEGIHAVRRVWEESGREMRPGDSWEEVRTEVSRERELFLVAEEKGATVGTVMGPGTEGGGGYTTSGSWRGTGGAERPRDW